MVRLGRSPRRAGTDPTGTASPEEAAGARRSSALHGRRLRQRPEERARLVPQALASSSREKQRRVPRALPREPRQSAHGRRASWTAGRRRSDSLHDRRLQSNPEERSRLVQALLDSSSQYQQRRVSSTTTRAAPSRSRQSQAVRERLSMHRLRDSRVAVSSRVAAANGSDEAEPSAAR